MKAVSVFAGHDANLTFYNSETEKYHVIEVERLVKKRYFRLHVDNSREEIEKVLIDCRDIARNHWGFDHFDQVIISADGGLSPVEMLTSVFQTPRIDRVTNHQDCHALSAYYQSPFTDALIVSYDGGGNDGFFNVYTAHTGVLELVGKVNSDFGGGYLLCASTLCEISEKSKHQLSLAGKMMGLCAYGKVIENLVQPFKEFFFDRNYKKLSELTGLELLNIESPWANPMSNAKFRGQESYDLAATMQKAFEEAFISVYEGLRSKYQDLPLIITGGCGLNVLLNERIRNEFKVEVFVPPNPNDCGLSLGAMFAFTRPKNRVDVTYNGIPLLDKDELENFAAQRQAHKTSPKEIADLLKDGKIIGIVSGDSEVGPRALGNRSIICDPGILEMKDILNSKVKFREWYRPFAPFCKLEDASTYFDSFDFRGLEYMGFAPLVKQEYRSVLPSITHVDGSSRLQTVTEDSHNGFYKILDEFGKISETRVLLNTSFNIRGLPILTTIEDALQVLDNTDLDYVVVDDFLFKKGA